LLKALTSHNTYRLKVQPTHTPGNCWWWRKREAEQCITSGDPATQRSLFDTLFCPLLLPLPHSALEVLCFRRFGQAPPRGHSAYNVTFNLFLVHSTKTSSHRCDTDFVELSTVLVISGWLTGRSQKFGLQKFSYRTDRREYFFSPISRRSAMSGMRSPFYPGLLSRISVW